MPQGIWAPSCTLPFTHLATPTWYPSPQAPAAPAVSHSAGAAGNFLCPAGALSFNAFKTVMDIDTGGTFNVSRVLYEKFFRVGILPSGASAL